MAFDDSRFRGGAARTARRLRLTASDAQLELGDGCVLSSSNTVNRTITFPDESGTVALLGDLAGAQIAATTTTLGSVKVPTSGHLAVDGSGNISTGAAVPLLDAANTFTSAPQIFNIAAPASANYGTVSVGSGAWDGTTSGFFAGSASGTRFAINTASTPSGNFVDFQAAGVSKFSITVAGNVVAAGTLGITGVSTFSDRVVLSKGLVGTPNGVTFASSMAVDPTLATVFTIDTLNATNSGAGTANLSTSPVSGKVFWVVVSADNNANVLTFGTHFKSTGTVTPGSGKKIAVQFVGDGTDAVEVSRTTTGV